MAKGLLSSPGFEPMTNITAPDPMRQPNLDPTGLVSVNRVQPNLNDGNEPQRAMERRLGTQPPSSFSGAGAGFSPMTEPTTTRSYADVATDNGPPGNRQTAAEMMPSLPNAPTTTARTMQMAKALGAGMAPPLKAAPLRQPRYDRLSRLRALADRMGIDLSRAGGGLLSSILTLQNQR